jgi:hypothetical protein
LAGCGSCGGAVVALSPAMADADVVAMLFLLSSFCGGCQVVCGAGSASGERMGVNGLAVEECCRCRVIT